MDYDPVVYTLITGDLVASTALDHFRRPVSKVRVDDLVFVPYLSDILSELTWKADCVVFH